jgi:uncharacterized protein YciI
MDCAEVRMSTTRRAALTVTAAALIAPARAYELVGGRAMYMVRRTYATDRDIAALRTPAEPEHQKHLLKFGETVVASAIIEGGKRIGSISISDSGSRDVIESYVYDDPFTKAGIYGSITIATVDLFKVDGAYNRAPAWFAPELQRRQQAAGFNTPVMPTGDVGAKTMFAVRRMNASDRDIETIQRKFAADHDQHLLTHSKTIVGAEILDDKNAPVGSFSISDTDDRADIDRFVYDDPFTKNGMYASIEIDRVDLYKLDGTYHRIPAWFADERKRRHQNRPAKES